MAGKVNRRLKENNLSLFYIVLVVLGTFSLVHGWFPQFHRLVYLCFGMLMVSMVVATRYFFSAQVLLILLYGGIVYFNHLSGDPYTEGKEVLDALTLLSCGSMAYYYLVSDDQFWKKWMLFACLFVILVDLIGTLVVYIVDPEIVRMVQGMANEGDNESTLDFYKFGIVEYEVLHGLPVLIPPLVMWFREKETLRMWRIIAISSIVMIMILLFIGDATTPLLLALFALIASFFSVLGSPKRNIRRLALISVIALPFLLSDTIKLGVLDAASNITTGELQKKIDDAKRGMVSGQLEGDANVRSEFYKESIDAFWRNPIIGVDDMTFLGGHSALLDRLGAFGLLGTIPWLLCMFLIIIFAYKHIPYRARIFYIIGIICFLLLMVLKNMSYFYTWFTFVVLMPNMLTMNVSGKDNNKQ